MIDPFSVFFIQTSPKHSILKKKLNVKQKQYCNKFNTFKIFFLILNSHQNKVLPKTLLCA